MANQLAGESSPYLLQHQDNPVAWLPWGDAAFQEAAERDVPIFLSIGYATCHWCHVMAHESFENDNIAKQLNEMVCIKVDREERPDIDAAYMQVCQAMTGSGGWPMTIIMTPDKRPFFAGTYFPPEQRGNRPGVGELVTAIMAAWRDKRSELLHQANHIIAHLQKTIEGEPIREDAFGVAVAALQERFDSKNGGFGATPKFPSPHNLTFLLDHAPGMALQTLDAMATSGLHDAVGGGFHRYCTDAHWHLPHFEKMLYDQATLLLAYSKAYEMTGKPQFKEICLDIHSYVQRDLHLGGEAGGGYASAEDADSEGEEGMFYTWTWSELETLLGEDLPAFAAAYQLRPEGNIIDESTRQPIARNHLHWQHEMDEVMEARCKAALFEARKHRLRPLRDDKILTDWNGLYLAGLSQAARVLQNDDMLTDAVTLGSWLHEHRADAMHAPNVEAMLDDYAYLAWGYYELAQATGDASWLRAAAALIPSMLALQDDDGRLRMRATADTPLNPKDGYDGALPSGNGVAAWILARLGRIFEEPSWEEASARIRHAFGTQINQHPASFLTLLQAPVPSEWVLVGPDAPAMEARVRRSMGQSIIVPTSWSNEVAWLRSYTQPGAYQCKQYACQAPVQFADL